MAQTWRQIAAPIIAGIISKVGTSDMKKLRAALRDAYPFGERQYHSYKIWCDEVRRQLGLKPKAKNRASPADPGQPSLFD